MKMLQCVLRRRKRIDISEFPLPSVKIAKHFHKRSVKVGVGYGKMKTVTVCGKQENMSRLTLSERIVIECRIYQKLSLGKIAKKIGKTTECVSREIRANRTIAPGEHHFGKDCHYAGECKTKGLCGKDGCSRRCVTGLCQ